MKKQINALGLNCPEPVVLTKNALDEVKKQCELENAKTNENTEVCWTLEVLVDNEIAVKNLTKFASSRNLEVTSHKESDKKYVVTICNGQTEVNLNSQTDGHIEGNQNKPEEIQRLQSIEHIHKIEQDHKIVVISSDRMGEGDTELGTLLIKGFVYALTQLEILPRKIILYNGGAKLSVEGSESLQDLQLLESLGVEVLTCGTCLKHYEIEDKLKVGGVTNMYDIAESMLGADTIVKP